MPIQKIPKIISLHPILIKKDKMQKREIQENKREIMLEFFDRIVVFTRQRLILI